LPAGHVGHPGGRRRAGLLRGAHPQQGAAHLPRGGRHHRPRVAVRDRLHGECRERAAWPCCEELAAQCWALPKNPGQGNWSRSPGCGQPPLAAAAAAAAQPAPAGVAAGSSCHAAPALQPARGRASLQATGLPACLSPADCARQDGGLRAGGAASAHQDAARQHQRLPGVCHVPGGVRQVRALEGVRGLPGVDGRCCGGGAAGCWPPAGPGARAACKQRGLGRCAGGSDWASGRPGAYSTRPAEAQPSGCALGAAGSPRRPPLAPTPPKTPGCAG
jgi:hypothetical protein